MKSFLSFIFIFCFALNCIAQYRNDLWCFGDSAGINFSNQSFFTTAVKSRGSCVSIADSSGNLLFYAFTRATVLGNTTLVYNNQNNLLANGTNIVGEGWYQELVITPSTSNDSLFYLFSIGVTGSSQFGLYYSIINPYYNNYNGIVTAKNTTLSTHEMCDGISAIKHGDGRDWWVIARPSNASTTGIPTNDFYSFLISPYGIQSQSVQSVGSLGSTNGSALTISHFGNKIAFVNARGLIEIYDFDRCSGIISNATNIRNEDTLSQYPYFVSCAFSSNDSVLYISSTDWPSLLLQYDLTAANIAASCDTIASISYPQYCGGFLRLAPDNKIYWSCAWYDGSHFNYPYPDTVYNTYNMNLSVINNPNSLGSACNFLPFSFNLNGKRTYYDLPNNPNYNMEAWGGSLCDTLGFPNSVAEQQEKENEISLSPNPAHEKLFITTNAKEIFKLKIINVLGETLYTQSQIHNPKSEINISLLSQGIYFIQLQTPQGNTVKKFIKN